VNVSDFVPPDGDGSWLSPISRAGSSIDEVPWILIGAPCDAAANPLLRVIFTLFGSPMDGPNP
jgi:hypothetical protein